MDAMSCLQFEENVHGLVRLEILDLAVRDRALDHAAVCPSCAALLAEVETWVEISEEDADDARREETPKPVELALLAAFRQQHRQRRAWKQSLQWASMGALAAGLLLAAAITYPKWSAEILAKARGRFDLGDPEEWARQRHTACGEFGGKPACGR